MLRWARAAGVILASLLLAMLVGSLRSARRRPVGEDRAGPALPVRPSWVRGFREDLVRGSGAVFIMLLALGIFLLGEQRPLDAGWTALEIAVAGVALAGWWNYGLTGKHPTAREAFQDALVTGLLAVSASPMAILQPPGSWSELLLLSQTVAAVTALIYHAANAHQITSTGKHLDGEGRGDDRSALPTCSAAWCCWNRASCCELLGDGPAAEPGRDEPRRGRIRGTRAHPLLLQRGRGRRAGPGDRGQAARVSSRPIWRCWPSRSPRSRLRGSRPWGPVAAVASWTVAPAAGSPPS